MTLEEIKQLLVSQEKESGSYFRCNNIKALIFMAEYFQPLYDLDVTSHGNSLHFSFQDVSFCIFVGGNYHSVTANNVNINIDGEIADRAITENTIYNHKAYLFLKIKQKDLADIIPDNFDYDCKEIIVLMFNLIQQITWLREVTIPLLAFHQESVRKKELVESVPRFIQINSFYRRVELDVDMIPEEVLREFIEKLQQLK